MEKISKIARGKRIIHDELSEGIMRDQMDDRERHMLKKIKRSTRSELLVEILVRNEKKWSRHLNMNLTLGSKRQQTIRYKGGLIV